MPKLLDASASTKQSVLVMQIVNCMKPTIFLNKCKEQNVDEKFRMTKEIWKYDQYEVESGN
jgi:hypothetical protein